MRSFLFVLSLLYITLGSAFGALAVSVIVDDRASAVTTAGTWAAGPAAPQQYLQTSTSSETAGSTMTFKFSGAGVAVYATIGTGTATTMAFSIDGATPTPFTSTVSTIVQYHTNIFLDGSLSDGEHSLVITQMNAGTNVGIDFFIVAPGSNADLPGQTLWADDQDSAITYSGSWNGALGTSQDFAGTLHGATTASSTASIVFDGTSIIVYGSVVQGTSGLFASFSIDGQAVSTYTPPPPATLVFVNDLATNQVLFTHAGMSAGTHTLVMTAEAADVLFFDYVTIGGFQVAGGGVASSIVTTATSQTLKPTTSPATKQTSSSSATSSSSLGTEPTSSGSSSTTSPSSSVSGSANDDSASTASKSHSNSGAVIGGIIAALVVLLGAFIFLCLRQRRRRGLSSLVRSKLETQFQRDGNGDFLPTSSYPIYNMHATGAITPGGGSSFFAPQQHGSETAESPYFVPNRPSSPVWKMPTASVISGGRDEVSTMAFAANRQSTASRLTSPHSPPRSPMTSSAFLPQTPYRDTSPAPGTPPVPPMPPIGAHPLDHGASTAGQATSSTDRPQTLGGQSVINPFFLSAQPNAEGYYDLGILSPGVHTPRPDDQRTTMMSQGPRSIKDWRTTIASQGDHRTSIAASEASLPYATPLAPRSRLNRPSGVAPPVPPIPASVAQASTSHAGAPPSSYESYAAPSSTSAVGAPGPSAPAERSEKEQLAAHWAARDRDQLRAREMDAQSRISTASGLSSMQNIGLRMLSEEESEPTPHDDARPPPSYTPHASGGMPF